MITTSATIDRSTIDATFLPAEVSRHFEDYLSWMSQSGNAAATVANRRKSLSKNLIELGIQNVGDLNADLVQAWIYSHAFDRASRTISSSVSEMKHFAKWLGSSGRLAKNPLHGHKFEIDADDTSIERFQAKFQRLFRIIEFVSAQRFGVSLQTINQHQCEMSAVCERTTRRDLELLIVLGIIDKDRDKLVESVLYHANPMSQLAQMFGPTSSMSGICKTTDQ